MVESVGIPAALPVIPAESIAGGVLIRRAGDLPEVLQVFEFAEPFRPDFPGYAEEEAGIVVGVEELGLHDLSLIVRALDAPGGFTRLLKRRQQHGG